MDYQPFVDLMHVVLEQQPDVVILTGPFVDTRQTTVLNGTPTVEDGDSGVEIVVPYETVFAQRISALIEEVLVPDGSEGDEEDGSLSPTQFVLVPALEDATAKWV
jgi:hypothetical protein